jgi:glycerol kinase
MKETTALGAAMVSFTGTGVFSSTEEAFRTVINQYTVFEPGVNRSVYRDLYEEFVKRVMR